MDRKTFRNIVTLISLAALLLLLVLRIDAVLSLLGKVVGAFEPLLYGFGIAFILSRPCSFFERTYHKLLPRAKGSTTTALAVLSAYLCLLVAVALIFTMIIPQLYESFRSLAAQVYANVPTMQHAFNNLLTTLNLDTVELTSMLPPLSELVNGLVNTLSTTLPHLLSFTGSLFSSSVTLLTSLVLSVYMLAGRGRLVCQISRILRAYAEPGTVRIWSQIAQLTADTFTRFVSGQLIEAVILGVLCFIGMVILRFPFAPLISVIIAVSALVPVAGAYIGAGLSTLLLVMVSPPQALGFLVFIFVLQQLEGNLIYPRVVGNSIGLPALWVLTAVLIGGGLFGLLGMLISVPAASVCYTLLRQDVNARLED